MRKPIDEIRAELRERENSLLLNVDGTNIDQTNLEAIYGPDINKVKWGAGIPHGHAAGEWRRALTEAGKTIFYDPPLSSQTLNS